MPFTRKESYSFPIVGKPTVDQNGYQILNLVELPLLPMHLIIRYLDMKSLNKIRRTNRLMNAFVFSHRQRFVSYEYQTNVIVECLDGSVQSSFHDHDQFHDHDYHRCFDCRRSRRPEYIPGQAEGREKPEKMVCEVILHTSTILRTDLSFPPDEHIPDDKWMVELDTGRSSFFRGFTDRFCNTHIGALAIVSFSFSEEDMDDLEEFWEKRRVYVNTIVLTDVDFLRTSTATVIRFLKIVKPNILGINDYNKNAKHILTEEMYNLLPSVRAFFAEADDEESDPRTVVPISPMTNMLPPIFYLASERIFPFEVLKTAFHSWWRRETPEIVRWQVILSAVYADPKTFARAIDLACVLRIEPVDDRVFVCYDRDEESHVRVKFEHVQSRGVHCFIDTTYK